MGSYLTGKTEQKEGKERGREGEKDGGRCRRVQITEQKEGKERGREGEKEGGRRRRVQITYRYCYSSSRRIHQDNARLRRISAWTEYTSRSNMRSDLTRKLFYHLYSNTIQPTNHQYLYLYN